MTRNKQNIGAIIGGHEPREFSLAGKEHCLYYLYDFEAHFKTQEGTLQKGQSYYELKPITGIKLTKK